MSEPSIELDNSRPNLYPELHTNYIVPNAPSYISSNSGPNPNNQNISHPLVYNVYPIYPGEAVPYVAAPMHTSKCKTYALAFFKFIYFSLIITQGILAAIALSSNWFSYCYWDFELTTMSERVSVPGKNSGSISSLYDDLCDGDHDVFPECPSVCSSIKGVRYTGRLLMWITYATFLIYLLSLVFFVIKRFRPQSKTIKIILFVCVILGFLISSTGFIYYYVKSDFKNHFDDVDKHKKPYWSSKAELGSNELDRHRHKRPNGEPKNIRLGSGFDLTYVVLGIQAFLVIGSRLVIGKLSS